ncbi:hypothetical protein ISF_09942 [Cordyceps fumosorosea ARSEF 2679]|uniref:Infection structure specific protein n=1 Tax=Cordyceps fumosorosea (strain ARSEF 2679) TaxID=1081104 RepID=A0A166YA66_CORFA|nr:hypothetical protein ISF_09942 [Cordyceps fumosorosea ARSEF 2679]OAA36689.1 hypothetical protein ISF_09942 [Cordyceps fumosorosea ARSEF 2679]
MRVHALSALSLVGLANTAAATQLDGQQQATDEDSSACLSSILALAEASPTLPAALEAATGDCVPTKLTEAASSFTSGAIAWYTNIVNAISDCPALSSASKLPDSPDSPDCSPDYRGLHGFWQRGRDKHQPNEVEHELPLNGCLGNWICYHLDSLSANAAARETGVIFAAVAMAAFGVSAL